jgi:V8-like Glu-specific endopeptidase
LKKYLFLSLLSFAVVVQGNDKVIYGDDNRIEIHQATPYWQKKADSTVALFFKSDLTDNGNGTYKVGGENYGKSYNLCADEPFREQQSAGFCSGSLVAPNLIMTAGHCVRSQSSCDKTDFVFGFGYSHVNTDLTNVQAVNVYSCKSIVSRKEESNGGDYAIIELDRAVIGHDVLPVRRSGIITAAEPILVIGHPAGIPTKLSAGANVREVKDEFFVANLDTYGGNSGSAVFNEKTGLVEGILVRGAQDFVYQNGCRKSNVCANDGCHGEDVTKVEQAIAHIPAF